MSTKEFDLVANTTLTNYGAEVRLWRHKSSGAELLSVLTPQDPHKVFGVAFRTPALGDTGAAHILEHVVLAGSEKYPVKDPFMVMLKNSMATFLNAMTYPDMTVYPVASFCEADFYNLVKVYLDAAFAPLLSEGAYYQEGIHFRVENHAEGDGPGEVQPGGVVYNEMKGALSSVEALLTLAVDRSLFPDTCYGGEAGGCPEAILDFTFEEMCVYYARYYQPSNARLFFYGDDPEEQRLAIVTQYLSQSSLDSSREASLPELQEPHGRQELSTHYPVASDSEVSGEYVAAKSWALTLEDDWLAAFGFQVLQTLLFESGTGLLRSALESAPFGRSIIAEGLQPWRRQWVFSVGLDGLREEERGAFEDLVTTTLTRIVAQGFDDLHLESALFQVEYELHNSALSAECGMDLFLEALEEWNYDRDVLAGLQKSDRYRVFRDHLLQEPRYLEQLIKIWLLDSSHCSLVTLIPERDYNKRLEQKESAALQQKFSSSDSEWQTALQQQERVLDTYLHKEDSEEELALMPRVQLDDVPPAEKGMQGHLLPGDASLSQSIAATGEIVSLRFSFPLVETLPDELAQLSFLAEVISELGTSTSSHQEFSLLVLRSLGMLEAEVVMIPCFSEDDKSKACGYSTHFQLTVSGLRRELAAAIDCVQQLLGGIGASPQRVVELLKRELGETERGHQENPHHAMITELESSLGEVGRFYRWTEGEAYRQYLKTLVAKSGDDALAVASKLRQTFAAAVRASELEVESVSGRPLTPAESRLLLNLQHVASDLAGIPNSEFQLPTPEVPIKCRTEVSGGVNYVACLLPLYEVGYEPHGSIDLICKLLREDFLWHTVREQGGAYGVQVRFNRSTGFLLLCSYRDPLCGATVETFKRIPEYFASLHLTEDQFEQRLISAIAGRDTPVSRVEGCFLAGTERRAAFGLAERQKERDELRSTTLEDVRAYSSILKKALSQAKWGLAGSAAALSEFGAE